jgi:ABC-type transport system substrate-binding protein
LENLNHIGIDVIDQGMSWSDFIYRAYGYMEPGGYDSLMLYWIGWGPDYLSPFNMIAPLFSNKSASDSAQYYNADVEKWLAEVLEETDPIARDALYTKMSIQCIANQRNIRNTIPENTKINFNNLFFLIII